MYVCIYVCMYGNLFLPFDERMFEAQQRKEDKYEELIDEIAASGTKAELHTIEVGTEGSLGNRHFPGSRTYHHFAGKISFS